MMDLISISGEVGCMEREHTMREEIEFVIPRYQELSSIESARHKIRILCLNHLIPPVFQDSFTQAIFILPHC
jgi:hypothetical protein